jgi:hypothetical protein
MDDGDRRQIHDLLHAYCDAADRADPVAVVGCFTTDATVDYGPGLAVGGRDDLLALFDRFLSSTVATSHHLTNVRIRPSDNGAEVTSYVMAWHLLPTDEHLLIVGRYLDTVVRTEEGWRLAHRRLEVHGSQGPPVPFHRLDRTAD